MILTRCKSHANIVIIDKNVLLKQKHKNKCF